MILYNSTEDENYLEAHTADDNILITAEQPEADSITFTISSEEAIQLAWDILDFYSEV